MTKVLLQYILRLICANNNHVHIENAFFCENLKGICFVRVNYPRICGNIELRVAFSEQSL